MEENIIHYGFGKEYLSNWGLKEALREVYQNFLDYGEYSEHIVEHGDLVVVRVMNDWSPDNLEFLRIGNSQKQNDNSIGKHGEGLKMAFLIFEREGLKSAIDTDKFIVVPEFISSPQIGSCFVLKYTEDIITNTPHFIVQFECPKELFLEFKENLIQPEDVEYSNRTYGDIVNKTKGNVYSGGLFVAHMEGLSRSYNIRPEHLPLDRDRSVPRAFDVNWNTSKILEAYDKWSAKDIAYSDTSYVDRIPEAIKSEFTPVLVNDEIEFTVKDEEGRQQVISNQYVKEALHRDSFFETAIRKLRVFITKKLGLYDMLIEFEQKHVHTSQAKRDFELILERVKQ